MLKLTTWNVNSINTRLPRVLEFLNNEKPDIVCFQELKCLEEKFPLKPLEDLGFHCAIFGQKTYNGVAIISKRPLTHIHKGFDDKENDPTARWIEAQIPFQDHSLTVISAYVPNGQEVGSEKYIYKLRWLDRCIHHLQKRFQPSSPIALVGDFNVAPSDLDVHDPEQWRDKILCSSKERLALQHIQKWGFTDICRELHKDEKNLFSWWDYRMGAFHRNWGLRIDLALVTVPLCPQVKESVIHRDYRKGEKPSDHAPVSILISHQN